MADAEVGSREDAALLLRACRGELVYCGVVHSAACRAGCFEFVQKYKHQQCRHTAYMNTGQYRVTTWYIHLTVCIVCVAAASLQVDQGWHELHQLLRCAAVCHGQS
jgi:hypothetical protein